MVASPANQPASTSGTPTTPFTAVPPVPSVSVSLAFKRLKLVVLAFIAIGAVAAAVLVFRTGVDLKTVNLPALKSDATDKAQSKLIDTYNSYTGNAAAALTKPIEAFATMALQLVLLRFAARTMLQPTLAWRVDKISALAAWALLYLLFNGFNSLNVQLRPKSVISVIQASDLALASTTPALAVSANATSVVPETTPGNLVTNTVLRTAVVPREWGTPQPPQCLHTTDDNNPFSGVEFGFPIRPWQPRLLPAAPPTKTFTISLTGTNTSTLDVAMLPMNASRAAMLFLTGINQAYATLAWFGNNRLVAKRTAPVADAAMVPNQTYPVDDARTSGLLPATPTGSEASEREWLVREAPRLLLRKFNETKDVIGSDNQVRNNDSEIGLSLRFTHVDLAPRFTFDAVTFDAAVNVDKYTTATGADGKTRYLNYDYASSACGPNAAFCMVKKATYGVLNSGEYDVPSQVQIGALCLNANGSETLTTAFKLIAATNRSKGTRDCSSMAKHALLVVSVAKKIVVDAVLLNETAQTKGLKLQYPVLVNARKIYSITVGRLGWETEDLAASFGAACRAGNCQGLQFPLADSATATGNTSEVLIAGVDHVPVGSLDRIDREGSIQRKYTPLVIMHEASRPSAAEDILNDHDAAVGDILLPHNLIVNRAIGYRDPGSLDMNKPSCPAKIESRLYQVLGNHIYMEDGVQPAYTSALFWLFQNGAVKTVVNASLASAQSSATKTTLQFDGNIQVSSLVASIPAVNVWLSLAGCLVLAVGVLATVTFTGQLIDANDPNNNNNEKPLNSVANVSDPRVIAQVMLDESRFPPMFLDRRIVDTSGTVGLTKMQSFQIASMTLETQDDASGSTQVIMAQNASAGNP